jgi:hypothetical protein
MGQRETELVGTTGRFALGALTLAAGTLAFFIDDSGDQILGDPANPLFALGGVSVHGADYRAVASAWRAASAGISRGKGGKHFSQGRSLGRQKRDGIHRLLQTYQVGRYAAVASRRSCLIGTTVEDVVLDCLKKRIESLLSWSPATDVAFVFEESARLKTAVERHFDALRIEANGIEISYDCYWMSKSAGEPLLQLADWLVHAVAGQVRHGQATSNSFTHDFRAAFHSADPKLTSYMDVTTVFPNLASRRTCW